MGGEGVAGGHGGPSNSSIRQNLNSSSVAYHKSIEATRKSVLREVLVKYRCPTSGVRFEVFVTLVILTTVVISILYTVPSLGGSDEGKCSDGKSCHPSCRVLAPLQVTLCAFVYINKRSTQYR